MDEEPRYYFFLLFWKIFLNKRIASVGVGVKKKGRLIHTGKSKIDSAFL